MIEYRIARKQFARDLSGSGAELFGGRWNSVGIPMLYVSESIALAMTEALVHLPNPLPPISHELVTIEVPEASSIQHLSISDLSKIISQLIGHHPTDDLPLAISRKIGDDFVKKEEYLLLKVPSAVVPHSYNYLVNPRHPSASTIAIIHTEAFHFDVRLRNKTQ
jgi:RES domain-containing protein